MHDALHRVARQQGIRLQRLQPSSTAIQAAIDEYRGLFRPRQSDVLHQRRRLALEAMRSLAAFEPRLFGALIAGDGRLDRVRLLLVADSVEAVILQLHERHIPWRESEFTLQRAGGRRTVQPALRFMAGDAELELVIVTPEQRSDPPRDPLTGRALKTVGIDELDALVAAQPD